MIDFFFSVNYDDPVIKNQDSCFLRILMINTGIKEL